MKATRFVSLVVAALAVMNAAQAAGPTWKSMSGSCPDIARMYDVRKDIEAGKLTPETVLPEASLLRQNCEREAGRRDERALIAKQHARMEALLASYKK